MTQEESVEVNEMKRGILYTQKEEIMHVSGPKGVIDISNLYSLLSSKQASSSQETDDCRCADKKCVALPPCPCPYSILSVQSAKSFLKNGFCVGKDLVPFEKLNAARRYVDKHAEDFMNQSVRQDDWRLHLLLNFSELEKATNEQKDEYYSESNVNNSLSKFSTSNPDLRLSEHAPILDLALSPKILSLAYSLTGSRLASCFYNQLGLRTPLLPEQCYSAKVLNYPKGAGFHLDGQANNQGTRFPDPWSLIIGVALRPLKLPVHGNFTVWKGTHLKYKWHKYPGLKRTRLLPDLGEATHVCLDQGDAVFGHVLLPHRGGKNTMKGVKRRFRSLKSYLTFALMVLRDEIPTQLCIITGENELSAEEIDVRILNYVIEFKNFLDERLKLSLDTPIEKCYEDKYGMLIYKLLHFIFLKEKEKEAIHQSKIVRDEYYEPEEIGKVEEEFLLSYSDELINLLDNEEISTDLQEYEEEINPFTLLDDSLDDFNEGNWKEFDEYEYDFNIMKKFLDEDMKEQINKYQNEQQRIILESLKNYIDGVSEGLSEKEMLYKKLYFKPINIPNWTREVVFFRFRSLDIDYESPERSPSILDDPFHEHKHLFDYIERNSSKEDFESFCSSLQKEKHLVDLTM